MSAAEARARGYRSAWADPEHVRLAMCRSWWDATANVERGPLAAERDQWREGAGITPSAGPRGYVRADNYAAFRCACKHLVYADDAGTPGSSCRFCPCAAHVSAGCAA